jgi:hypothetical protein
MEKEEEKGRAMKLSLDLKNTNLMETHYVVFGIDEIDIKDALSLVPYEELEMLSEGLKRKIVIRGGKKKIVLKCGKGMKVIRKGKRKICAKMSGAEKTRRSRQAKKAARKARSKKRAAAKKRARSLLKRKMLVRR